MKEYKFKSKGSTPKDCTHIVEYGYGCSMQVHLIWRLINVYGITLDKKNFYVYCDELGKFIEKEHKLNESGEEIISHYSSIDMEAELLAKFLESKFGIII